MTSLKRKQGGFTIVELLIVIVVIGILAALVITTFAGVQRRARNTERETDIKAIHGHLEAYYANNGYYPGLADATTANLPGLDADALTPPNSTATTLAASAGGNPEQYGYNVTKDDGSACTTAAKDCQDYTLTANLEGGGTTSKDALN